MLGRTIKAVRQNIVAWLALFVALTGTSIAATHYVITSTKQIKPSVLKALHGANGKQGPAGKTGPRGETGTQGTPGVPGTPGEGREGKEGPEGKPGSALAYAHISANGKEVTEEKGFKGATVENPAGPEGEGVYCISGLSPTPHNVVATLDAGASEEPGSATAALGQSYHAKHPKSGPELCKGAQITVETSLQVKAKKEFEFLNAPFFIAIN